MNQIFGFNDIPDEYVPDIWAENSQPKLLPTIEEEADKYESSPLSRFGFERMEVEVHVSKLYAVVCESSNVIPCSLRVD